MRQDPGLLVQPVGAERLDRARNGRVEARAPVGELGLESDLLSQRMPEGVLRFGVQRALEDELGALEPRERAGQIARGEVGDPLEDGPWELLADQRRGLEQPPLPFGETVDASREHGLDRGRDLQLRKRAHQAIVAAAAFEDSALDQRSRDLLGEEGIAAGALVDQVR